MLTPQAQREIIGGLTSPTALSLPPFEQKLAELGEFPLKASGIDILQINVGKLCNQVCKHCHVDAGPTRKENMTRENFELCLEVLKSSGIKTVDLTGGAPEMNPNFRWFVEEVTRLGRHVIDRCNLTILKAGPLFADLPEFFKAHRVHLVSSLPHYDKRNTDRQRGDGVFDKSIEALHDLNKIGYGRPGTGLQLDLVYNPTGTCLPGPQKQLERNFKHELHTLFGIEFNELFTITNMPISRFLEYLIESNNFEGYMERLLVAFNPAAVRGLMCRNILSVGWDGFLFDCDFNQMLDIKLDSAAPQHIRDFNFDKIKSRNIRVASHCYGCTAGCGSSCSGQTT